MNTRYNSTQKQVYFILCCLIIIINSCKTSDFEGYDNKIDDTYGLVKNISKVTLSNTCEQQIEQTDYSYYRMTDDGYRIGDVMPYYDTTSNKFYVYFLKDIWNDNTRHPIYGFTSTNLYSYTQIPAGEIISCSTYGCDQNYAIGTGSVIKKNNKYYYFYTAHNPNYPSQCVTKKEGIMVSTSSSLNTKFNDSSFTVKNASGLITARYSIIYAPLGQDFDEYDNFRDPYVFLDNGTYYMLVSARKYINSVWRGVIVKYTSTDLTTWEYQGVVYDGGAINYFMMETPQIFKIESTYYLLFSDINTKHVLYRKSNSVNGVWNYPVGYDRFEGTGIYSAKLASDGTDNYLFGWTAVNEGNTDAGQPIWGGNLVCHKVYQDSNGDLKVCIPHTLKSNVETNQFVFNKVSQWGDVTNLVTGQHTYQLVSKANYDVTNVLFEPINEDRFEISATVKYGACTRDFGFLIGACDGYDNVYSLRFVPSENKFRFDKTNRSQINSSTIPDNDVPFTMLPNTDYTVQIVIENSMAVVYINNQVALSCRIYKATNTTWGIFADNSDATFTDIKITTP